MIKKDKEISENNTSISEKFLGKIVSLYDGATVMFVTSTDNLSMEPDLVVKSSHSVSTAKEALKWLGKSFLWKGKLGVITRYHTDFDKLDKDELLIKYLDNSMKFIVLTKKNIKKLKKLQLFSTSWHDTQALLD